jgi:hypothetical protein
MQIVCLTLGPAFFAAGIYLNLSRIVVTIGESNSRITPRSFPRFFIPCDIISLVLQATGGGIASVAAKNEEYPDTGTNIMVAGLAFQVLAIAIFILICLDFAIRTLQNPHAADEEASAGVADLRPSVKFKGFVAALALATVCIFIRSIFRVIELAQGWRGELIKNETLFIVLEGALIVVAVLALNVFHPGWCFPEGYDGDVTHALKRKKDQPSNNEKHTRKWTLWGGK